MKDLTHCSVISFGSIIYQKRNKLMTHCTVVPFGSISFQKRIKDLAHSIATLFGSIFLPEKNELSGTMQCYPFWKYFFTRKE
jgi:hypothetical protein